MKNMETLQKNKKPVGKKGQPMQFDFSNLGENIARLRHDMGMTQESLAYQLGVTSAAVSKWERQLSCPDISLLPQMAEIFGVTIDDLFVSPTPIQPVVEGLPWEDDGTVRVVVFEGKRLCTSEVYECPQGEDLILLIHPEEGRHTKTLVRRTTNSPKTPPE